MSCLPCIRCYTTMYCPSPKQFTKSFSVGEFSLALQSLSCTCPLTGVCLEDVGLFISLSKSNEEVRNSSLEIKQDKKKKRPIKFQSLFRNQNSQSKFIIINNTSKFSDLDIQYSETYLSLRCFLAFCSVFPHKENVLSPHSLKSWDLNGNLKISFQIFINHNVQLPKYSKFSARFKRSVHVWKNVVHVVCSVQSGDKGRTLL